MNEDDDNKNLADDVEAEILPLRHNKGDSVLSLLITFNMSLLGSFRMSSEHSAWKLISNMLFLSSTSLSSIDLINQMRQHITKHQYRKVSLVD